MKILLSSTLKSFTPPRLASLWQSKPRIFPPSLLIIADIIRSLADSKDDGLLMAAVTREFSQFGTVFVKIRRDEKTGLMPFAFCQFTVSFLSIPALASLQETQFLTSLQNKQDADNALVHGRGIYIHGRPCRTERAKSSRKLRLVILPLVWKEAHNNCQAGSSSFVAMETT